ncbi:hypothetical protein PA25_23830 [Pseudoalteromonas sp. A25]|nr:hypothetical protein PA25_23830 [Pseudoalteromonas sp. A25]
MQWGGDQITSNKAGLGPFFYGNKKFVAMSFKSKLLFEIIGENSFVKESR